ncbi:uncharacterized protein LODBEIA_P41690 [Lodderomyces beijingensis]|uniref:HMG box domain-containing protein n=1 Tax=Lodderomyces beijingensis TaxID=1775926 RepID=A0ABP0ZUV2_9ASCO
MLRYSTRCTCRRFSRISVLHTPSLYRPYTTETTTTTTTTTPPPVRSAADLTNELANIFRPASIKEKPIRPSLLWRKKGGEFDPQRFPDQASAIHTSLGWFFIPPQCNQSADNAKELDLALAQTEFTQQTNREEVQKFVYEWCADCSKQAENAPQRNPRSSIERKSRERNKTLNELYQEQLDYGENDSNNNESKNGINHLEPQRLLKRALRDPEFKLRFKCIDATKGKYEVRGLLLEQDVYKFYEYIKKQESSTGAIGKIDSIKKSWEQLTGAQQMEYAENYRELLSDGKAVAGKMAIDLALALDTSQVLEDGCYYLKPKSVLRKYASELTMQEQSQLLLNHKAKRETSKTKYDRIIPSWSEQKAMRDAHKAEQELKTAEKLAIKQAELAKRKAERQAERQAIREAKLAEKQAAAEARAAARLAKKEAAAEARAAARLAKKHVAAEARAAARLAKKQAAAEARTAARLAKKQAAKDAAREKSEDGRNPSE